MNIRLLSALTKCTSLIFGQEELHVFQTISECPSALQMTAESFKKAIKVIRKPKTTVKNKLLESAGRWYKSTF